jgi:hypothetical protein
MAKFLGRLRHKVKRGDMTGVGETTRSLVSMVTARSSNGGQCNVNSEGKCTRHTNPEFSKWNVHSI